MIIKPTISGNDKLKCSICSGKFSRSNESQHKKTLLHLNAELKLKGKNNFINPVSSIQCDICKGKFWEKSKNVHMQSKKHLKALKHIYE